MKKNTIPTLVAVSTASLGQRYVDVPPTNPLHDHGIAWVSGSGGIRG